MKPKHSNTRQNGGHTLLEVTLSLVILGVVFIAVGSAVVMAAHAVPDKTDPLITTFEDSKILARIVDEMRTAQYLPETEATAVTMVVPDRTGNGRPDRIRYAWSGTVGDPLTYSVNDSTPANVINEVQDFDLSYTYRSSVETLPGELLESAVGRVDTYSSISSIKDVTITTNDWPGFVFTPPLSADKLAYRIEEVRFLARKHGPTDGVIDVQVRDVDASGLPGNLIMSQGTLLESTLQSNYIWVEIPVAKTRPIVAGEPLAVVIAGVSSQNMGQIYIDGRADVTTMVKTTDGGSTWSISNGWSVLRHIYGTTITQDDAPTIERTHVTCINISLQSVAEGRSPVVAGVRLVRGPQVLYVYYQAEFAASPVSLEVNGAWADWIYTAGVDPSMTIVDGAWVVGGELANASMDALLGVTTIEARMQATSASGSGAVLSAFVNPNGGLVGILTAQVKYENDGTQTVTVYNQGVANSPVVTVSGVDAGWVDVRLVVLDSNERFSVMINGLTYGTYTYPMVADPVRIGDVILMGSSDAKFDEVRISVGGSESSDSNATSTDAEIARFLEQLP